ncbi:hypothetical protein [Streptomyces sp. NPDC005930]|uniref:hypothetical protein n=1 Tax=Streptomyces sp. NPDC005930 TaxID=3364736 RepID=UPI0036B20460
MTDAGTRPARDDAAVLVARASAREADSVADWEFPADPRAVASARGAATAELTEWHLEDNAYVTGLIVSCHRSIGISRSQMLLRTFGPPGAGRNGEVCGNSRRRI